MTPSVTLGAQSGLKIDTQVPGDKSVSHRALIMGALASGHSTVEHLLESADCMRTAQIFRDMGIKIEKKGEVWHIDGKGLRGLKAPKAPLDCGNSGTTMRLLSGILSAQSFDSELFGDESLSRRPMDRVITPLRLMGAKIEGQGPRPTPPLKIRGGQKLKGIRYELPVASAQVKSALLLAGLYADGATEIIEKEPTRDHTETFFKKTGIRLLDKPQIRLEPGAEPKEFKVTVPGDISSAAFLIAIGLLVPGSRVKIRGVLWNKTRNGFVNVLQRMGARIDISPKPAAIEELVDLDIQPSPLKGVTVEKSEIPSIIDELPMLMVVATQAQGVTRIFGAEELRVKETDRIESMVSQLAKMGARITAGGGDITIEGPAALRGAEIESFDDHRTAMAFIVAAMIAQGETTVRNIANINTSFPGFLDILQGGGCRFKSLTR